MKVLKFGGSSVERADTIQKVVQIILQNTEPAVVVVSALGGVTDKLISIGSFAEKGNESYVLVLKELEQRHLETVQNLLPLAHQSSCLSYIKQQFNQIEEIANSIYYLRELSTRTKDRLVSFGELLSSYIIASYLQTLQVLHEWLDSREVIITNSQFGNASVDFTQTYKLIKKAVLQSDKKLFIAPGFVASDHHGRTTTLGRGGSDYSAAIYAAALDASVLEIWTDVNGMMTADPRMVSNAKNIPFISYQEAMELSHFGAKVIYAPTIQPVMQKNIPTCIKNTFQPHEAGTLIENIDKKEGEIITGISVIKHIALLSIEGSGMVGIPGFSKKLFEALAQEKINVVFITQASSEYSICVAINATQALKAQKIIDQFFETEYKQGKINPVKIEENQAIIALVGDKMKSHPGISGRMFGALGRNGINVRAIAQGSSERNISAVIAEEDSKKAANVLHEAFFESSYKQLNVFIVGLGKVGSKLLSQIQQQQSFLLEHLNVQLRVVGIGNSRKMFFSENNQSIHLAEWKNYLEQSHQTMQLDVFVNTILQKNLRNSVFVDVTANQQVASVYGKLLSKAVSVVACNKIAASSSYAYYSELKSLAKEFNASYLFETNVGAGLPVIGTLGDLRRSGDVILKIYAVLSGTLNFVFNKYNGTVPFSDIVRQAQEEGYTEPDPRLDLSGTDVMRKILILAREAGEKIEMEDIENESFLPESCLEGDVENFYKELYHHESYFKNLYEQAVRRQSKLKYMARFEEGKAKVGLQFVAPDSDFFHLYAKDNIVLFYTQRYAEQPLVVKGAGAGADVTASGVFADIIRIATP